MIEENVKTPNSRVKFKILDLWRRSRYWMAKIAHAHSSGSSSLNCRPADSSIFNEVLKHNMQINKVYLIRLILDFLIFSFLFFPLGTILLKFRLQATGINSQLRH